MKRIQTAASDKAVDRRTTQEDCAERRHVSAYVDDELDLLEQARFEQHAVECAACARDVAEQRCLLRVLDMTIGGAADIRLPNNFAQIVTARAQADMSGVRRAAEKNRAVHLCCLLAAGIGVLLGAGLIDAVLLLAPVSGFAVRLASVLTVLANTLLDLGAMLTVVLRFLGNRFVVVPTELSLLLWCGFVGAFLLLLRSINSYPTDTAAVATTAATSSLPASESIEVSIG